MSILEITVTAEQILSNDIDDLLSALTPGYANRSELFCGAGVLVLTALGNYN